MDAPMFMDNKRKVFEETFVSAFPQPTKLAARNILNKIRVCHPASSGWFEFDSEIRETPSGYVAVRHHAQYR